MRYSFWIYTYPEIISLVRFPLHFTFNRQDISKKFRSRWTIGRLSDGKICHFVCQKHFFDAPQLMRWLVWCLNFWAIRFMWKYNSGSMMVAFNCRVALLVVHGRVVIVFFLSKQMYNDRSNLYCPDPQLTSIIIWIAVTKAKARWSQSLDVHLIFTHPPG